MADGHLCGCTSSTESANVRKGTNTCRHAKHKRRDRHPDHHRHMTPERSNIPTRPLEHAHVWGAAGELAAVRASGRVCVRACARSSCFPLPAAAFARALAHRLVGPCPCARARAHVWALVFASGVWLRVGGAVSLSAARGRSATWGLDPRGGLRRCTRLCACVHVPCVRMYAGRCVGGRRVTRRWHAAGHAIWVCGCEYQVVTQR
jgi:hypothetical protein